MITPLTWLLLAASLPKPTNISKPKDDRATICPFLIRKPWRALMPPTVSLTMPAHLCSHQRLGNSV